MTSEKEISKFQGTENIKYQILKLTNVRNVRGKQFKHSEQACNWLKK